MLCGEYAVLDGAPAISMAVNRRARASIAVDTTNDAEFSTVRASGYTEHTGRFRKYGDQIEWQEGQEHFAIIDSLWRAADVVDSSPVLINLDSSEFIDSNTRRKLGIGSSAAISVALCAAMRQSADIAHIVLLAQRAHVDLQGGVGSGIDIACSLHGGLIEYHMDGASVMSLAWPDGLRYRLLWSGVAASTRQKLLQLDAAVSKPSRVRLASASESMAAAWRTGSAERIVSEYSHYIDSLREFSIDHGLGIFDAGHEEISRAANAVELAYKPCGAGGGDIGILFGTNDLALDAFVDQLATQFTLVECQLSQTGVVMEAMKENKNE